MRHVELFTPWREPASVLRQRTVGRDALLQRLEHGIEDLVEGRQPLPIYFFGPRGVGKSHLVALARAAAESRAVQIAYVPEDVPAMRSAAELLRRCEPGPRRPAWEHWRAPTPTGPAAPNDAPALVVIEGLDRRLDELDANERRVLRGEWARRPRTWLIGTGVELGTTLTDIGEAFYGWFDPVALDTLDDADARELMDRVVPETVRDVPHWEGRREALLALAGGSPRVLLTLAETCASPEAPEAATTALLGAVDRFTPHYQLRFRDLAQQAQRIVDLLAAAPRELTPAEMAQALDTPATSIATQARRMAQDGVLLRREDEGRSTWYRVAEPLFRYWLEYRTAEWSDTRVSIATTLLEELFTPARPTGEPALPRAEQRTIASTPFLRGAALRKGELHPAILAEISLSAADPDLGDLLTAAFAANVPDLVARVLVVRIEGYGHEAPTSSALEPCLLPATPCLRRPDLLVRWMTEDLVHRPDLATLTWACTLAEVSDDEFRAFRGAFSQWRPDVARDAELATLTALGMAAPGRLADLLVASPEPLVPTLRRAAALAGQLAEPSGGHLHPELERLRGTLAGTGQAR